MAPVLSLLIAKLVEHFGRDPESITPQSSLEELELDSLAVLELLTILVDEHGIPMPEDSGSLKESSTLSDVAELIEQTLRQSDSSASFPHRPVAAGLEAEV
ncbi:acyl carrier protein [Streptomyces violascens]|uniref:acyl carrier protein n=1 Tax=Streptomyces violascens TaxID=67381 RepID=UPI003664409E